MGTQFNFFYPTKSKWRELEQRLQEEAPSLRPSVAFHNPGALVFRRLEPGLPPASSFTSGSTQSSPFQEVCLG